MEVVILAVEIPGVAALTMYRLIGRAMIGEIIRRYYGKSL
jgi:hypothetical protein